MLPLRKTGKFLDIGYLASIFSKLARPGPDEDNAYLRACLEHCEDLGSASAELQGKIKDTVSEYHLSPARANLIRCLDLRGAHRVLELGPGCGSITRYLGEQGLAVDAVESCPDKYVLTKMRCRDLGNVRVIQADYQELMLPLLSYDVIFMICVTEDPTFVTSGKPEKSFRNLVRRVKKFLRPGGVLVAAFDKNQRTFSCLSSFRERSRDLASQERLIAQGLGIRYCEQQHWREVFEDESGECIVVYPFPDYRFPRVLLADNFIASDAHAYSLLYRILRKNEGIEWRLEEDEFFHWKAMNESGRLADAFHSSLIVSSSREGIVQQVVPFDFVHFSSEIRKAEYRTCTLKLRGEDRVVKRLLHPHPSSMKEKGTKVRISELESIYERGPLVASLWMAACRHGEFTVFEARFSRLLDDYLDYVRHQAASRQDATALVDLLPSNLVASSEDGQYRTIDQEWGYGAPFSTDFILFRAVLWFGYHNRSSLARYSHAAFWKTVRDFVAYCFATLSVPFESRIEEFVALEDAFHAEIAVSGFSFSTWGVLDAAL